MQFSFTKYPIFLAAGLLGLAIATLAADSTDQWNAPPRAARKKNPIASDEKSIAAGKDLYITFCLPCHGPTGKGDGPAAKALEKSPGNLSNSKMWDQTDGALFWKLTEGRSPMPSFDKTLTEEQRWQVVNYIRTLAPRPKSDTKPAG